MYWGQLRPSDRPSPGPRQRVVLRRLDELLPQRRTAAGAPSATDFLLHDMPRIIDRLADDFDTATLPVDEAPRIRMLIASGSLVAFIVVYDDHRNRRRC